MDRHTLESSTNSENYHNNTTCNDLVKPNYEFIYRIHDDFY